MTDEPVDEPLRSRLRAALTAAMKVRDRTAVAVLRSALGAIDNAEAVVARPQPTADDGPIAGARTGLGAAEATRLDLTETEIAAIVRAEVTDRRAAADLYQQAGHDDRAERLTAEALVLAAHLREP
jgi:uncharacterized protein YqeY